MEKKYTLETSYFRVAGNLNNSLSIVPDKPAWYPFQIAEDLVPDEDIYFSYCKKHIITREDFINQYIKRLLTLDPYDILEKYNNKVLLGKSRIDSYLFCPRMVIITWLKNTINFDVHELTPEDLKSRII